MLLPLHDQNPIRYIKFAYVTYGLMALNIAIFALQSRLNQADFERIAIGFGMIPIVVRDLYPQPITWLPDWANLLTYGFLHADWLHLLTNMLFLWIFGDNIEDAFGHLRFLLFYLACTIFAALAHLAFNLDGNGPLVGASGAVAGVLGAYVLLYPHAKVIVLARLIIPIPLPVPAFWVLGFWIASQAFYLLIQSSEPVAWWAHLGGFLAGIILALALRRRNIPLLGGRAIGPI